LTGMLAGSERMKALLLTLVIVEIIFIPWACSGRVQHGRGCPDNTGAEQRADRGASRGHEQVPAPHALLIVVQSTQQPL
jgi:hypothetical protein